MLTTTLSGATQIPDTSQLTDSRSARARARLRAGVPMVIAVVVLVLELGATYGSATGEPFAPVDAWGETRPTDVGAFAAVVVGGVALCWMRARPTFALLAATGAYAVFLLRDYELGLFLPPMILVAVAAARGHRWAAASGTLAAVAASLWWVGARTAPITDGGVAMLAWIAFGTVMTVFFVAPWMAGELVHARRLLNGKDAEVQR